MQLRELSVAAFAAFVFAAAGRAQENCPMEATRRVPMSVLHGPKQLCGGLDWNVGGVQVTSVTDGCPLYVIVTPAHDVAEPSTRRTQVMPVSTVPVTKVTFRCQGEYFLFLRVGTACVFDAQLNVGAVHLMVTRPCADPASE